MQKSCELLDLIFQSSGSLFLFLLRVLQSECCGIVYEHIFFGLKKIYLTLFGILVNLSVNFLYDSWENLKSTILYHVVKCLFEFVFLFLKHLFRVSWNTFCVCPAVRQL